MLQLQSTEEQRAKHTTLFKSRDQQSKRDLIISQNKSGQSHTSWEESTDHKAEVDGGHSEDQQEDKDQRGVTVGQHCSVRAHLKTTVISLKCFQEFSSV